MILLIYLSLEKKSTGLDKAIVLDDKCCQQCPLSVLLRVCHTKTGSTAGSVSCVFIRFFVDILKDTFDNLLCIIQKAGYNPASLLFLSFDHKLKDMMGLLSEVFVQ